MDSFINARMRKLQSAAANGDLAKQLGLGTFHLTGWLGDVDPNEPRIRLDSMVVKAKNLHIAQQQYLRQFKSKLPADALNLDTGLIIIRVGSQEPARTFPADTPSITGKVKFWSDAKGTGFVTVEGKDYFIHHSEILCDDEVFPTLTAGQEVAFIPATYKDKPVACSVTTEV